MWRVLAVVLLLAAFAASDATRLGPVGWTTRAEAASGDVVPGQYIVVLKPGNDPASVAADFAIATRHVYRGQPLGFAGPVPDVKLPSLRADRRVASVEPDYVRLPLDELSNSWGVDRIDAEVVRAQGYSGAGIRVGVIDTGIDFSHDQLAARCVGVRDFNAEPDVDLTCGTNHDGYGHGSHVSGIIAADADGNGVVGVAPGVSLYDLKVCNSSGVCPTSDIIAALQYARDPDGDVNTDDHLDVVNISLGSRFSSSAEEAAVNAAYDAGVFVVAAAGNSGNCGGKSSSVEFPGAYAKSFAVGAVDRNDLRPCFSSTGPALDIAAPGVAVLSTVPTGSCTLCDPSGYRLGSGTSMATPHVTGTVALMKQKTSGVLNEAVRNALVATADDLGDPGFDVRYGNGLVDAEQAVLGTDNGNDLPSSANSAPIANAGSDQVVQTGSTVNLDGSSSSDPDGDSLSHTWQFVSKPGGSSASLTGASTATPTFTADVDGTYEVELTVSDGGLSSSDTVVVTASSSPSPGAMHVGDLDGSSSLKGKSGKWSASVTVTILDSASQPVANATVFVAWSTGATASGTTDGSGRVTFSTGALVASLSSVSLNVTNVTHVALTYDSVANADPDGDSNGTTIAVSK